VERWSVDLERMLMHSMRASGRRSMSTEHQKYSTEDQSEAIKQYAARRGLEIVRTYTDAGKSGLRLDGRDALKRLRRDVAAVALPAPCETTIRATACRKFIQIE
jgi:Resolvase, N terminal domain